VGQAGERSDGSGLISRVLRTSKGWVMDLRVGGIYSLPNRRELIVLGRRENGHVSYRLSARASQYEISSEGRLICDGTLTAWDVSNLTDTGRSIGVERIAPSRLAEQPAMAGARALHKRPTY